MAKGNPTSSSDPRFAKVALDPRFKTIAKSRKKVKLDDRFKDVVSDTKFTSKYTVDKRGRVCGSSAQENFRKFYDVSGSEDEKAGSGSSSDGQSSEQEEDGEDSLSEQETHASGSDDLYARARGQVDDDSSSEDEVVYLSKRGTDVVHEWAEFDAEVERTEDLSRRLAVCNVDWDRVGAKDLLVLLNSFRPQGGTIKSVTIYPSEYGKERLAKEDVLGPLEILKKNPSTKVETSSSTATCRVDGDGDDDDSDDDENVGGGEDEDVSNDDEGDINDDDDDVSDEDDDVIDGDDDVSDEDDDISDEDDDDISDGADDEDKENAADSMEKIRQYQLNRLKYYYAVVDCDSLETASKLYDECDGMEMELSQSRLDLRFVPDEMTFDDAIKERAMDRDMAGGYEPLTFSTSALQQSKVNLTWDETDVSRLKTTMRKFTSNDVRDMDDFKAYLASSGSDRSDDDGEEEEDDDDVEETACAASVDEVVVKSRGQASCASNGMARSSNSKAASLRGEDVAPPATAAAARSKKSSFNKYKALMKEISAKEREEDEGQEMEISFDSTLSGEKQKDRKKKKETSDSKLTSWEQYLKDKKKKQRQRKKEAANDDAVAEDGDGDGDAVEQNFDFNDPFFTGQDEASQKKQKSKKKKKKKPLTEEEKRKEAELELLMVDEDNSEKNHFSLKAIMKKDKLEAKGLSEKKMRRKRKRDDDEEDAVNNQPSFDVDLDDSRFSALFTEANYAIDPTAADFKKTKVMDTMVAERRRRQENLREENENKKDLPSKVASQKQISAALIKSAKAKANSFKRKS